MLQRNVYDAAPQDNDLQPDGTDEPGRAGRQGKPMRHDLSGDADAAMVHRLANALAAIRCAAEILRDTPDLAPDDRRRFAAVVLEGEYRLETLLPRLARRSGTADAHR
jgi:nitrogen-specific signal transduction histidine kinase